MTERLSKQKQWSKMHRGKVKPSSNLYTACVDQRPKGINEEYYKPQGNYVTSSHLWIKSKTSKEKDALCIMKREGENCKLSKSF